MPASVRTFLCLLDDADFYDAYCVRARIVAPAGLVFLIRQR